MNYSASRRSSILVVHNDPLLCAGLLAALRQASLDVYMDVADAEGPCPIDVVIADYPHAMRLADPTARGDLPHLAGARIMALTSNDREVDIRRAIEAGVHGYLLLGCPLSELIEGVTTVAHGVRYLCRSVAQRMADSLTRVSLTSREIDVLRLVVDGDSNKAIARKLQIEVGTVKSHMSAIMTKLGATSRTHAAGIAATRGLIDLRLPPTPKSQAPALRADRYQLQAQLA
jgi:DNA-binding NarL/FixJ family response regulator